MVAEKGTQHILVCGDKKQSLAGALVSFDQLLRRDEICWHHSCSFSFPVGRKNHSADSVSLLLFHVKVANPSLQGTCATIS